MPIQFILWLSLFNSSCRHIFPMRICKKRSWPMDIDFSSHTARLAITTSRPASSDLLLGEFTPTVLSCDPLTATVVAFSSICSLPLVGESAAREDDKCRQRLCCKGMGSPVVKARFRSWDQQFAAAAAHADKPMAMIKLVDTTAHAHRTDHNVHKDSQRYHQLSRHPSFSGPLRRTAAAFRVALFTTNSRYLCAIVAHQRETARAEVVARWAEK